ncbi:MAG: hypothetical protein PQJ59_09620 [Spirochaetales bacterium]|nr:hypothetical protein [Spirochaetales bacterium]
MIDDRGSGSVNILIVLIFLSIMGIGFSRILNRSVNLEEQIKTELALQRELEQECRLVLHELTLDQNSEVNSPDDSVFNYIVYRETKGVLLTLTDISSRINKEYVDEEVFPISDLDESVFTEYSWNNEDLNPDEGEYPFSNVLPLFNVYYIEEELLELILSSSFEGEELEGWEGKLDEIISLRESSGLSVEDLEDILDLDENEDQLEYFLNYLGVTTWFWEIKAAKGSYGHTIVAARFPRANDREETLSSEPILQIIKSYGEQFSE